VIQTFLAKKRERESCDVMETVEFVDLTLEEFEEQENGNEQNENHFNNEYSVQYILDARESSTTKKFEYFIQWEGYPISENSWIKEENIFCKNLLTEFWKRKEEEKRLKSSDYEIQRIRQIQKNQRLLEQLSLTPRGTLSCASPHRIKKQNKIFSTKQKRKKEIKSSIPFSIRTRSLEEITKKEIRGKTYGFVEGVFCHQCRLKTKLDDTIRCINEEDSTEEHYFCRMCLRNHYGEELEDINVNRDYVCPFCRIICDCFRCKRASRYPNK